MSISCYHLPIIIGVKFYNHLAYGKPQAPLPSEQADSVIGKSAHKSPQDPVTLFEPAPQSVAHSKGDLSTGVLVQLRLTVGEAAEPYPNMNEEVEVFEADELAENDVALMRSKHLEPRTVVDCKS